MRIPPIFVESVVYVFRAKFGGFGKESFVMKERLGGVGNELCGSEIILLNVDHVGERRSCKLG